MGGGHDTPLARASAAVDSGRDNLDIATNLAGLYLRRKDSAGAIPYLERAAQIDPGHAENLTNLATAYKDVGRQADCERARAAALAQDEHAAPALVLAGLNELDAGRTTQAREYLQRASEADPTHLEVLFHLGRVAQAEGERDSAVTLYRRFLALASPQLHGPSMEKATVALAEFGGER